MAIPQIETQLTELYVGLIGRAPDRGGLDFWANGYQRRLEEGEAPPNALRAVAESMFESDGARDYYPTSLTDEQIVEQFYENVLGREGDAQGIAFWTNALSTPGRSTGDVLVSMIDAVTGYSGDDPAGLQSQRLFDKKATVADHYVSNISEPGNNADIAGATALIDAVTAGTDLSTETRVAEFVASNTTQQAATIGGIVRDTVIVERGETLRLTDDVQLADGAELIVREGASLLGEGHYIEVFGRLATEGQLGNGSVIEDTSIFGNGGRVDLVGARFTGGELFPSFGAGGFGNEGGLTISQSAIDARNTLSIDQGMTIDRSIFRDTPINAEQGVEITNSTFLGKSEIEHTSWVGGSTRLEGNNFLGEGIQVELSSIFDMSHAIVSSDNYWGTGDEALIADRITDGRDDLNINGIVDITNAADAPTPDAPQALFGMSIESASNSERVVIVGIDATSNISSAAVDSTI